MHYREKCTCMYASQDKLRCFGTKHAFEEKVKIANVNGMRKPQQTCLRQRCTEPAFLSGNNRCNQTLITHQDQDGCITNLSPVARLYFSDIFRCVETFSDHAAQLRRGLVAAQDIAENESIALPQVCTWQSLSEYELIEGSLEVKLPTIWTVEKQR